MNDKNMKKLWIGINSITSQKTYVHSSIDKSKDVNGKSETDLAQMSNIFNKHFANIADNMNKAMLRMPMSPLRYLGSANKNSLFLSPVIHFEVEDLISNLNLSKT